MIKKTLGIFIPIITCITLSAQDYVMFQTQYLELRNGEHSALQAGVLKHNKKYHGGSNGPKAYLWYVHTGPNAGQYNWGLGPVKFSHMDEALGAAHIKDWENNVAKYARSHGHTFIIRDEDLTYNPQNETVGENILVKRFKVKQGSPLHVQELEKAIGSIADVLRKTNAKIARRVYKTAFRQKVGELQLVYPFSSWERFEDGTQGLPADFWESYEKINGAGSQQKNVGDVIEKHSNGITNEVMTMVK